MGIYIRMHTHMCISLLQQNMHCLLSDLYLYQQWFLFRWAASWNRRRRGFWTKYCEVESLWMGLCISYQPIWVQIGFEVLPTSTMGLFPQHIKPCFQPLWLPSEDRGQAASGLRPETNAPISTSFSPNQFNLTLINLQMCSVGEVVGITAYRSKYVICWFTSWWTCRPQLSSTTHPPTPKGGQELYSEQFQWKRFLWNEAHYSF